MEWFVRQSSQKSSPKLSRLKTNGAIGSFRGKASNIINMEMYFTKSTKVIGLKIDFLTFCKLIFILKVCIKTPKLCKYIPGCGCRVEEDEARAAGDSDVYTAEKAHSEPPTLATGLRPCYHTHLQPGAQVDNIEAATNAGFLVPTRILFQSPLPRSQSGEQESL